MEHSKPSKPPVSGTTTTATTSTLPRQRRPKPSPAFMPVLLRSMQPPPAVIRPEPQFPPNIRALTLDEPSDDPSDNEAAVPPPPPPSPPTEEEPDTSEPTPPGFENHPPVALVRPRPEPIPINPHQQVFIPNQPVHIYRFYGVPQNTPVTPLSPPEYNQAPVMFFHEPIWQPMHRGWTQFYYPGDTPR